jgi:hypothetical protein
MLKVFKNQVINSDQIQHIQFIDKLTAYSTVSSGIEIVFINGKLLQIACTLEEYESFINPDLRYSLTNNMKPSYGRY